MQMRVEVTGYAYIDIPDELKGKDFDEIMIALQDKVSEIDCGELEHIDSKWVDKEDLKLVDFCEADKPFIEMLLKC